MDYRSRRVTQSAGARSLFRATGLKDEDFRNPIIAVANSFTEFVPGHVHLAGVGRLVCEAIKAAGGTPREFNTIAVDDGIAMGHDGMLYSLPSRDLIADSVEYMVNAHCADALICISNCDKITPGMLMAGLRLNIPTIYVSGGPMEAGRINVKGKTLRMDGSATYYAAVMPEMFDHQVQAVEKNSCPTCGSCSGMFTANSMNCLAEAIGLALPGNGSLLATHVDRRKLFEQAAQRIVALTRRHYGEDDASVLPRSIATRAAFLNAISVDIAMGGSTNTILHLLAMAHEAEVDFTLRDIDERSRRVPHICKVAPSTPNVFMEDVHRAGGVIGILGELERGGLIDTTVGTVAAPGGNLAEVLAKWDILRSPGPEVRHYYSADASGVTGMGAFGHETRGPLDLDRSGGCIRDLAHPYSQDGGIAILFGNIAPLGSVVKTAAVDSRMLKFTGPARVFEEEDAAANAVGRGEIKPGDVMVIRYEGPRGGPGMQEMLRITMMLHGKGLSKSCALITDGRFSGGSAGLSIGHMSPEAAAGGAIGLVQDGDPIVIDIPNRRINVQLADDELTARRRRMEAGPHAWQPAQARARRVSRALRAYAAFAASADRGGIREIPEGYGHASAPGASRKDE